MPLPGRSPRARVMTTGLPFALAGTIALALTPPAAHAVPVRPEPPRTGPQPLPPAPAGISAPAEHVVEPGDTISAIAARYGLRTADVLARNGLGWSSLIHPGQVIRLAEAAAPAAAAAAPPAAVAHTVSAGDTISAIARAHGLSTQAVLDANGLGWSSIIYPGQTLLIPGVALAAAPAPAPAPAPPAAGLDAEQTANAQLIIRVGRELGVSDRGIAIALGTAMVESWLRNLDWGDRDSLGLFQQRPSAGWGSAADILDPVRATRAFFGGGADPNGTLTRGLLDIPGWEAMAFADAAQAVQISAFPDRYAQWEQPATAWVAALG